MYNLAGAYKIIVYVKDDYFRTNRDQITMRILTFSFDTLIYFGGLIIEDNKNHLLE